MDRLKKGDILICIDDDSQAEDLGMSGIVLPGRRDLTIGKEYEIEIIVERHVPKNSRRSVMAGYPDEKIWTDKEYESVKMSHTQFFVKGIIKSVWGHCFKIKEKNENSNNI